jgi:hypothetical protein
MVATEQRVALTRVTSALRCRCQGASPPAGRALGNRRAPPAPDPRLIFARPLHLRLPLFRNSYRFACQRSRLTLGVVAATVVVVAGVSASARDVESGDVTPSGAEGAGTAVSGLRRTSWDRAVTGV